MAQTKHRVAYVELRFEEDRARPGAYRHCDEQGWWTSEGLSAVLNEYLAKLGGFNILTVEVIMLQDART